MTPEGENKGGSRRSDWSEVRGKPLREITLEPELAWRLQMRYQLTEAPNTLAELAELGRSRGWVEFGKLIKAGKAVMGETDAAAGRGQSIVLPEGREAQVMCGYDALITALLRGQGQVRASCFHCGEKMEVRIDEGRVVSASSPTIVFWFGEGPKGIPICDHLNLFPDVDHLLGWLETNPEELGVPLSLDQAVELLKRQASELID